MATENIDSLTQGSLCTAYVLEAINALVTAELVVEILDFELNIDGLLDFLYLTNTILVRTRHLYQSTLSPEQVTLNHHRFSRNYGQLTKDISDFEMVSQEHWGRFDRLKGGELELSITKSAFTKILTDGGFEEPRIILRRWKEEGKLNCEADRLTRKRKLSPTSPRLDLYVIRILDEDTEVGEDPQIPVSESGKLEGDLQSGA